MVKLLLRVKFIFFPESFANTTCFVMNEKIIDCIVATIADNERFVRYTAYCTLTNIVQYTRCRQIPLSSDDLIVRLLDYTLNFDIILIA